MASVAKLLSPGIAFGLFMNASSAQGEPHAEIAPLPIINLTHYYSAKSIEKDLRAALNADATQTITRRRTAVLVDENHLTLPNGETYCSALVGFTEAAPKGRMPWVPNRLFGGIGRATKHGALSEDELDGCMGAAIDSSVAELAKLQIEEEMVGLESTSQRGGTRKPEPSEPRVTLFSSGVSDEGRQALFAAIPDEFAKAFDYRRIQWVVLSWSASFEDQIVCYSRAGVVARSPEDRNPRLPANVYSMYTALSPAESRLDGAGQRCRDRNAADALRFALQDRWDSQGLLANFSYTLEQGVTPVSGYARSNPQAARARTLAAFRMGLKVGSESHCGLVVEVKGPIAKIQAMIGEVWMKTSQLYPKGDQNCRFVNGVYQEP